MRNTVPITRTGSTQRRRESVEIHSLKTEEKTVTAGDRRPREGPNPYRPRGRMADSPPVHQQVCLELDRMNDDLQSRSTP